MKKYPKVIRYILSPKWVGNSLYILLPSLINQDWKMTPKDKITMEFDTDSRILSMKSYKELEKEAKELMNDAETDRKYFETGELPQEKKEGVK